MPFGMPEPLATYSAPQGRESVKSKLLNSLWHHTLPDLGVDARRQQTLRELAYRLFYQEEEPFSHILCQIHGVMGRSRRLLSEVRARPPVPGGPVLIWTMRGGGQVNATEAIIAHALRLRGIDTQIVLCDEFLPACEQRSVLRYPTGQWNPRTDRQICDHCHFNARQLFDAFELPVVMLSSLVTPQELATIQQRINQMSRENVLALEDGGVQLGGEIRAFLNLYYRALAWPDSPQTEELLRRGAAAALMLRRACDRILDQERPQAVLTSHGVYLLWGVIKRVAQRRNIPLTVWGNGYRTGTLRVSQGNWFEVTIAEPGEVWEGLDLTPERVQRLDDYLGKRWDGQRDRRVLFDGEGGPNRLTLDRLGLDPAKPTLGIFPNVAWDADLNFKDVVFRDMSEWLVETVRWFAKHPEFQVVVRAHPGEAIAVSNERASDVVLQEFPTLPNNVAVIPAENKVNSYGLARLVRAASVYGSQFGLELACRGLPVIVASECFYRGKGFTHDVKSRSEYFDLLSRLHTLQLLDDTAVHRARTYAYHYYFRRLIPFRYLVSEGWSALKDITLQNLGELLPGRDPYLDLIVQGILENKSVVLDV